MAQHGPLMICVVAMPVCALCLHYMVPVPWLDIHTQAPVTSVPSHISSAPTFAMVKPETLQPLNRGDIVGLMVHDIQFSGWKHC
jgi:hypothetical protein